MAQNSVKKLARLTKFDIVRAIEEDRVALQLQPIVRANEPKFRAFDEGLIRIFDQEGYLRFAGEFIHLVQGTEYANYVDQIALELACARLRQFPALRMSVNMSMITLWDEDWLAILRHAAQTDPSVPERLIIEFTESDVMVSPEQTLAFMHHCRKYGVAFAVDDFGAGHTVLGHLRDFRFDIMKIDGSICRDLGENEDNQVLVGTLVTIAKHFEMMTVAEFIDNHPAANKARQLGVDALQGFLYGQGAIFNRSYPNLIARALQEME